MLALVENSKAHTQLFDAWGLADLELHLDFAPYLDDAAIVSTPQGAFTEVDSFLDSGPNDRHFVVAVDQNDLQDGRRQRGQDLQRLLSLNISSGELPDDAKAPRWLSVICERKASRPPLHLVRVHALPGAERGAGGMTRALRERRCAATARAA